MGRDVQTWITGEARTGKTTQLVEAFQHWLEQKPSSAAIIFAANHTTRRQLTQQLLRAIGERYPVVVKTPLGFIEDEVTLFSPLWWESLDLNAQFPLRLRSETEQDLALTLWHNKLLEWGLVSGKAENQLVRRILDILQLAGASGTPLKDISGLLHSRLSVEEKAALGEDEAIFEVITQLILQWRDWCLEHGFLTYGLIYYLYGEVLLPNPIYQDHLKRRYRAIFADDVDDYPAIAQDLAKLFIEDQATAVFTFNPSGKVRFGLSADPDVWESLASHCEIISLSASPSHSSRERPPDAIPLILEKVVDPSAFTPLPDCIQHLPPPIIARSQMLRTTAEIIIAAINAGKAKPEDIAIIAPGLDEIARYTLIKLFTQAGIAVSPLNEQRPLMSSALVRSLLTLTCLVYPELGRWIDNSAIAEMLVVLTEHSSHSIDPIRAGLLADSCYQADPSSPRLLDIKTFPRWDRIGYEAQTAYDQLREWIQEYKNQQIAGKTIHLVSFFNQAIQQFLWKGNNLPVADLTSLRELTETAQHYLEVQKRIQNQEGETPNFIQLIKQGTITANPYPLPVFENAFRSGITLSNIFQYRSHRATHPWQFWLDIGSPLWFKQGAANLFASSVFLRNTHHNTTSEMESEEHLQRLLKDLLNRAQEKVYLCQSDLDVNGTEQNGILLSLVHTSTPYTKLGS
ncbi:hypothetical protein PCC7418_2687 [Halothece sp. PCC 7418]|uniref:ATP-binding protein n=1 Tax=Halothece sp. (strain PCC 7418) TaxID=65093 RepID=UPI0002A08DD7|nr:ATP-binding protein [Halothece sp. PCC 7418]AFZ44825.1 hypothetical protein PCC7418_2687 [Halothece sp. PCC 7418]